MRVVGLNASKTRFAVFRVEVSLPNVAVVSVRGCGFMTLSFNDAENALGSASEVAQLHVDLSLARALKAPR